MNESTLTPLKVIVERAVRPVRASTARKRKLREELLAHVMGVFEEEAARLGDDRAALERTALRFGNPAEVTSQLQESVPAGDRIVRFWEGSPGESAWRTALRLAGVTGVLALVSFLASLFAAGWVSVWPRDALVAAVYAIAALPLYLFGLTFLTDAVEKTLFSSAGASRLRVALSAASSLLFLLLVVAGAGWLDWATGGDHLVSVPFAGMLAACSVVLAWALAQSNAERRHYHEEWGRLPTEVPS